MDTFSKPQTVEFEDHYVEKFKSAFGVIFAIISLVSGCYSVGPFYD